MSYYKKVFFSTLIVVGIVTGVYFLIMIRVIVVTLLAAIIFAAATRPLILRLQQRRVPKAMAILVVDVAILFFFGLLLLVVVPPLIQETIELAQLAPAYLSQMQDWLLQLQIIIAGSAPAIDIIGALDRFLEQVPRLVAGVAQVTVGVVGAIFGLILVLVMSFYWLMEREDVLDTWLRLLPEEKRQPTRDLWEEIESKLGAFVRGQLILAAAVGFMAYVGLGALGIQYSLVLAIIAAVTELVPFVGPVLGAIPAVIIGLLKSPLHGLAVIGLFVIIQQLENHILAPKVMQYALGMSPLVVILALLIGGSLMGVIGALLAVPVAAALNVLVIRLLLERRT